MDTAPHLFWLHAETHTQTHIHTYIHKCLEMLNHMEDIHGKTSPSPSCRDGLNVYVKRGVRVCEYVR